MVLGMRLRRLREGNGVSREQAADVIHGSESKISRLELGQLTVRTREVADLLTRYGLASGSERDELLQLARYANTRGWWHDYPGALPTWFRTYVGLESAASQVRTYETQFVPGLLQTESYIRAVTRTGQAWRSKQQIEHQVEQRVASRQQRQMIRTQPGNAFWAIIDEGALRRPIGGRKVMRQQLAHLLHLIESQNAFTIQVLPFAIGAHAGEAGAFTYLRFPNDDLPDIVYSEQLTRAQYIYPRDEVEQYLKVFNKLAAAAQKPADSADTIAKIMEAL
jgi:transcriptional regulator with XRE-family HTH domain